MLTRYSGSISAAALITATLIYWMQLMISAGDFAVPPRKPVTLLFAPRLPPPPVVKDRRPPPQSVIVTRPTLPEAITAPPNPTTVRFDPDGPVTPPGPPSPQGRPDGRQGPWITDGDIMLVAQAIPIYPIRAISLELEGFVVAEFTVTKHGAVTNVDIVESTHSLFEAPARAALAKARYRPRVVNGAAVDVHGVTTRIEFRLDD